MSEPLTQPNREVASTMARVGAKREIIACSKLFS